MKETLKYSIAIHGGAGTILKEFMTPEAERNYRSGLEAAVRSAASILDDNGSALDAVETAVKELEDNPIFNAGRGSVFTHGGKNEMDACIMDGRNLRAGAITCVENIRNPISLARAVMEKSVHVFMSGSGAAEFAALMGLPIEEPEYFFTQERFQALLRAREVNQVHLDHSHGEEKKFGTVGAVALDRHGNLAAATSTGGMTNKRFGRIGDSPVVGAGTYANNKTCAVSCTGHGEFFLRAVVAYDISCLIEYKGLTLRQACEEVVMKKLRSMGGEGGLIAVDAKGHIETPFNSEGMYRARLKEGEAITTGIYIE